MSWQPIEGLGLLNRRVPHRYQPKNVGAKFVNEIGYAHVVIDNCLTEVYIARHTE